MSDGDATPPLPADGTLSATTDSRFRRIALARHSLTALSWLGLLLGIAWTAEPQRVAGRLPLIALALRNPVVPLLLSLACALAVVASSAEPGRVVRRARAVAWLALITGTLLVAGLSVFFRWAAGDLYPFGDPAILEIYTLHAVHGIWELGPYSQFGWHHPGPLYFYVLAPFYLLSGQKTIALHVGALAINVLSLCGIGSLLIRHAAPAVACAAALALGAYLVRLEPILSNYWNPHVVVVPAALYLVLAGTVAVGRHGALPLCVFVGSFLVQTHISLAPYVAALGCGALAYSRWRPERTQASHRSFNRWTLASALLLVLLWLFPLVEQATQSPGNLGRILQFFGGSSPGQDLRTAVVTWGDMICALFRTRLEVPEGLPLSIPSQAITATSVGALIQLLLLTVAAVDARRRNDWFHAALVTCGLLASVVGLWSITRVKSLVGDYTIFWLSAIGTLNWAVVAGLAVARVIDVRWRVLQQGVTLATAAIVLWTVAGFGIDQLKRARRQGLRPPRDAVRVVQLASDAILDDMRRKHVQRPLLQMSTAHWGTASGVLLQVYKRGPRPAVDAGLIALFGAPLSPTGQEDRLFVIADASTHASLTAQSGYEFLANVEDIYIHTRPLVPTAPIGAR